MAVSDRSQLFNGALATDLAKLPSRDNLTPAQETAIIDWLDHIGEHHQPSRLECLERCRQDPEARAYFLKRAREVAQNADC